MVKRLIINADDFGVGPERDRGIIECIESGGVTSVSVLAGAPHAAEALQYLRGRDVGVAVHINLSEGRPVSQGCPTLLDASGVFTGKYGIRERLKTGKVNLEEARREIVAQIQKLVDAGVRPTHLDGHQHVHVYPGLPEVVAAAAKAFGIRWIRCPLSDDTASPSFSPQNAGDLMEYAQLGAKARKVFEASGLRCTDHFRGAVLARAVSREGVEGMLRRLPEGVTEYMTHPGYSGGDDTFAGPDRELELRILTSPEFLRVLSEEKIELTHFGKL